MTQTAGAEANPDVQSDGQLLDGEMTCVGVATEAAREYAARVRFYGLLAGVGDQDDVDAARETVKEALRGINFQTDGGDAIKHEDTTREASRQAEHAFRDAWALEYNDEVNASIDAYGGQANHQTDYEWVESRPDLPDRLRQLARAYREAQDAFIWAQENRTAVMHSDFLAFIGWFRNTYNKILAAIRDGTWKVALCRVSAEAGFAVAEAALIAALAPIGLGAAAAVLRIGAKTIDFGSPLVRISVRATRTPRAGRLLDPDHETHEVDFDRPINTDTEPVGDERRIMGEENQGNVSRTQDAGPVDGDGEREGRRDNDQDQREDVWEDGSYRNPNDPEGIRRTADGEMMIQNKDGTWRPVSAMSDPNMIGGDDGRRHNPQVGRWGETVADNYAKDQGWEKISGPWTTMDSPFTGPHRLDGVYRDPGPPPRYIIPDAKGLNSPQSTTKAGVLQMSKDWITPRLAKVGLERAQLRELTSSGYHPVLLRVDKNGKVTETWLDDNGNPIPAPSWRTEE